MSKEKTKQSPPSWDSSLMLSIETPSGSLSGCALGPACPPHHSAPWLWSPWRLLRHRAPCACSHRTQPCPHTPHPTGVESVLSSLLRLLITETITSLHADRDGGAAKRSLRSRASCTDCVTVSQSLNRAESGFDICEMGLVNQNGLRITYTIRMKMLCKI